MGLELPQKQNKKKDIFFGKGKEEPKSAFPSAPLFLSHSQPRFTRGSYRSPRIGHKGWPSTALNGIAHPSPLSPHALQGPGWDGELRTKPQFLDRNHAQVAVREASLLNFADRSGSNKPASAKDSAGWPTLIHGKAAESHRTID